MRPDPETINVTVAQNLRRLRNDKSLSLDALSERTGVSKSMLGQIERGTSSPTVTTIQRIADGLRIRPSQLLETPKPNQKVFTSDMIHPLYEDDRRVIFYPFFSRIHQQRFELLQIQILPGGTLRNDVPLERVQTYLIVNSGILHAETATQTFQLPPFSALNFSNEECYTFSSRNDEGVLLTLLHVYM